MRQDKNVVNFYKSIFFLKTLKINNMYKKMYLYINYILNKAVTILSSYKTHVNDYHVCYIFIIMLNFECIYILYIFYILHYFFVMVYSYPDSILYGIFTK